MVLSQSTCAKSLSGSQKQSNPTEWAQNSLILTSLYLDLKVVHLYQDLLFQNRFRYIHTSGPIVLDNPQRPLSSSQYTLANIDSLLVFNFSHLISIP